MSRVTVYSTKTCQQCRMTYRALDSKNIGFDVVDVEEHPDAAGMLRGRGISQLPVVDVDGGDSWTGFRPDKIGALHLDVGQHYNGKDFVTVCSCGAEFTGTDPDDADAAAFAHCFPEEVTR